MIQIKAGSTNVSLPHILRTTSNGIATTGATITNIDLQYWRVGSLAAAKVDATALAAVDSAHADNKAIEVDATDQPGLLRVDWPDGAFADGADRVVLTVKLAGSFTEHLWVELVDYDPHDAAALGLSNLNATVSSRSDGTGVTLHGDYDPAKTAAQAGDAMDLVGDAVDAAAVKADAVTEIQSGLATSAVLATVAGYIDTEIAAIEADTQDIQSRLPAALIGGRMSSDVEAINNVVAAAVQLAKAAQAIGSFTVDDTVAPTTTMFETSDIIVATTDRFNGRHVNWYGSASMAQESATIEGYELVSGRGRFTVTQMTAAPVDTDTGVIT